VNKWTDSELNIVRKNFGKMTARKIADLLPNRTTYAVDGIIRKFGLSSKRKDNYLWTDNEMEILRDNVGKMSCKEMESILPGRPEYGISSKIAELSLEHNYHPKKSGLFIDITNEKFGRLTAIEYVGEHKWLCQCECGNTSEVPSYSLRTGLTKSCGCLISDASKKAYGRSSRHHVYAEYRCGAKKRGFSFDIAERDFMELVVKPCFYCGNRLGNVRKSKYSNGDFEYTGIDRIDSSLGYTKDNCVPCCSFCNWAKSDEQYGWFIEHASVITSNKRARTVDDYYINQWKGNGERVLMEIYKNKKQSARDRKIKFELNINEVKNLISLPCSYCSAPPSNIKKRFGKKFMWSGIDRINSDMGYKKENCTSSCAACNRMKYTMSVDEFFDMAKRISEGPYE